MNSFFYVIEVNHLSATGPGTCKSKSRISNQLVEKARFPYVASAKKSNLNRTLPVGWLRRELIRMHRADNQARRCLSLYRRHTFTVRTRPLPTRAIVSVGDVLLSGTTSQFGGRGIRSDGKRHQLALQSQLQNLVHRGNKLQFHFLANVFGNLRQISLVVFGQDHLKDAMPVSRQQFLLE